MMVAIPSKSNKTNHLFTQHKLDALMSEIQRWQTEMRRNE